jgi:hypothetical protein
MDWVLAIGTVHVHTVTILDGGWIGWMHFLCLHVALGLCVRCVPWTAKSTLLIAALLAVLVVPSVIFCDILNDPL